MSTPQLTTEQQAQLEGVIKDLVMQNADQARIDAVVAKFMELVASGELPTNSQQNQKAESENQVELTFEQQLEANPNLKAFYDASSDKNSVQAMFNDPNFTWDEDSSSFRDERVVSDESVAIDQSYWNNTSDGALANVLAANGFTRDDIAKDKNGQYTIGGSSEVILSLIHI